MRRRETFNKGFTLVEVVVVLVVLVIVTGAAYGAVKGLVSRAEQNARDQTARSLFMAAQTALTHLFANDQTAAAALGDEAAPVNLALIQPQPGSEEWNRELLHNSGDIVSLAGDAGTRLRTLLEAYVDDKTVLAHHIVIEFNKETGNMLACFYSEETALSHGGGYNVYDRSAGALKADKVGYFGVEYTGARAARLPVEEPEDSRELAVMFVDYDDRSVRQGNNINGGRNYGLLTLECALPVDVPANTVYTLALTGGENAAGEWTLIIGPEGGLNGSDEPVQIDIDRIGTSLETAIRSPIGYTSAQGEERSAMLFFNPQRDQEGRRVLVLVLDCLESERSIGELYREIASGPLTAIVSAEGEDNESSYDDMDSAAGVDALYGGVTESGAVRVASVRHLNNVRYNAYDSFLQTADIDMVDYSGEAFPMPPIERLYGVYDGGNHCIEGLVMPDNTPDAGLFAANSGSITRVYLLNAKLVGTRRAGGIAAINDNTISNCTVYQEPVTEQGDTQVYTIEAPIAGGIAAENSRSIKRCYVGAGVRGVNIAGGVAGESSGTVENCEVCTAMSAKVANTPGALVGRPNCGAVSGSYYYGEQSSGSIDLNQRWVFVSGEASASGDVPTRYDSGVAGGIVGLQTGGTVEYCVNAAHVGARTGVAGGVVGSVYGNNASRDAILLHRCYNAGWVDSSVCTGGVAGLVYGGTVSACYNTAPINCHLFDAPRECLYGSGAPEPKFRYLPHSANQKSPTAGGVVGRVHMYSLVEYCYSASYVYAGNQDTAYAGAIGRVAADDSAQIKSCYFLRNCMNVSERCYPFENRRNQDPFPTLLYHDGLPSVTMLDEARMKLLIAGGSGSYDYLIDSAGRLSVLTGNDNVTPIGAGPQFKRNGAMKGLRKYWFPVLRAGEGWGLADFHRTPYYPVLERFGELDMDMGHNEQGESRYVLTAWLPAEAGVTLRLWMRDGEGVYHRYDAGLSAGALTFASGTGEPGTITGQAVESAIGQDEYYYQFGCREKYVITIPAGQFAVRPEDFHAQIRGSSGMTNNAEHNGVIVWSEAD